RDRDRHKVRSKRRRLIVSGQSFHRSNGGHEVIVKPDSPAREELNRLPDSSRAGAIQDANGELIATRAQLAGHIDAEAFVPADFTFIVLADLPAIQPDRRVF